MNILKLVLTFMLSIFQIITPFAKILFNGGPDSFFEDWSETDEFKADYAITLQKDPAKDFVVLNLTDIQLSADKAFGEQGVIAEETIRRVIEKTSPDLITLSGDNAWSLTAYLRMVDVIDSYGIPWAPSMGNHDGDNGSKWVEGWDAYIMSKAENCIFKYGPKGMGYGNYVINITENGKIIHSIFMLDSHSSAGDTPDGAINIGKNPDGSENVGYDHLWASQLKWYEWAVKGIEKLAGHTVESSAIMHIPVIEMRDAMAQYCDITYNENGSFAHAEPKEEYKGEVFGSVEEWICSAEGNNGFFTLAKDLGSTKNMIFGHDHVNDFSAEYEGIRLSYSLKTGPGCYWNSEKNGGSTLTIGSDGHAEFAHCFIDISDVVYEHFDF